MPLPNFYIIGAPKCGTTSLQAYLNQHPDVIFSRYKEPNYFAFAGQQLPEKGPVSPKLMHELIYFHSITDESEYLDQFTHHQGERIIGDASVRYLYTEPAAQRIKAATPDAKLVAVLREPVSRLYSHFCMNKQYQIEPLDLMDAIDAEQERIQQKWGWDWHYTMIGKYASQVKRYFDLFDPSQIKIFLYDDFQANPGEIIKQICEFLAIDSNFKPNMEKRGKEAYMPKNLAFDRWLNRKNFSRTALESVMSWRVKTKYRSILMQLNGTSVPKIDPQHKIALQKHFTEDIAELSDLLNRNINWHK